MSVNVSKSTYPTVLSTLVSKLTKTGEVKLYEIAINCESSKSLSFVLLKDNTVDVVVYGLDVGNKPTSFKLSDYAEEHFEYLMFDSLIDGELNKALYSVIENLGAVLISEYYKSKVPSLNEEALIQVFNNFILNIDNDSLKELTLMKNVIIKVMLELRIALTMECHCLFNTEVVTSGVW